MKIVLKSPLRDLLSFLIHIKKRNSLFKRASSEKLPNGKMNTLSSKLHPLQQELEIQSVSNENSKTKRFRLIPAKGEHIAFFRAGQYLSVDFKIGGTSTTRAFSICSTPSESYENNYYDITVKFEESGFVTPHIFEHWKKGLRFTASEPMGYFYYEPMRDQKDLVFLAGGTGITPFRSIIGDLLENNANVNMTLLYGIAGLSDKIFGDHFEKLMHANGNKFQVIFIYENAKPETSGERGFIDNKILMKLEGDLRNKSFFICGPPRFQNVMAQLLKGFKIPDKNIRRDSFNLINKQETSVKDCVITVENNSDDISVYSDPSETILVALERAGLHPPAKCRTGECGWCRSKLVSGEITQSANNDGRRLADKKNGYFHPCSAYAASDIKIAVPENSHRNMS